MRVKGIERMEWIEQGRMKKKNKIKTLGTGKWENIDILYKN